MAAVAVGLYLGRGPLLLEPAARALEKALQEATGYECRLGRIAGSVFGDLEINSAELVGPERERPFLQARLEGLHLTYRLWELRHGFDAALARARLSVAAADVVLTPADLPDTDESAGQPTGPPPPPVPLPGLPIVTIHDAHFRLVDDAFAMDFDGIVLEPEDAPGRYRLTVADGRWTAAGIVRGRSRLEVGLIYGPEGVALEAVSGNGQPLAQRVRVDLRRLPGLMPFDGVLAGGPGSMTFNGLLAGDSLHLALEGHDLATDHMTVSLGLDPPLPRGRWDVKSTATFDLAETARMQVVLQAEAQAGGWGALDWDRLAVRGGVNDGRVWLGKAEFQRGPNHARLEQVSLPLYPLLEGQARQALVEGTGRIALDLGDIPELVRTWEPALPPAADDAPPHRLELEARLTDGVLDIQPARLCVGRGLIDVARFEMQVRPLLDAPLQAALNAAVRVDLPDLSEVSAVLGPPVLGGRLQGTLQVAGPIGAPRANADLRWTEASLAAVSLGDGALVMAAEGARLTVERAVFQRGKDRLDLAGSIRLKDETLDGVRLHWSLADAAAYSAGWWPQPWQFHGALQGICRLQGPWRDPVLHLDFSAGPGRLHDREIKSAAGIVQGRLDRLEIERFALTSDLGDVTLAGTLEGGRAARPLALTLARLDLAQSATRLALEAPGRIVWDSAEQSLAMDCRLMGPAGRAILQGRLGGVAGHDFSLTLIDVNSRDWLKALGVEGVSFRGLDMRLAIEGSRQAPQAAISGKVRTLELGQAPQPLQCRFEGRYAAGRLAIAKLEADDGGGQRLALSGTLPLDWRDPTSVPDGAVQIKGSIASPDLGVWGALIPDFPFADGILQADFALGGTTPNLQGVFAWRVAEAHSLAEQGLPPGAYASQGEVHLQGDRLEIAQFDAQGPHFALNVLGAVDRLPPLAAWRDPARIRERGRCDLTVQLTSEDLRWMSLLMPGVRRTAGRLAARAALQGPLTAPDVRGSLHLAQGELQPEADTPALRSLEAELEVDPRRVQIQHLSGELGSAPFQIAGTLEREGGKDWAGDLRLTGSNLLLYRREGLRLRADTDLRLSGSRMRPALTGQVALTSGLFSRPIDYLSVLRGDSAAPAAGGQGLFSFTEPPLRNLALDVRLVGRTPFRIKTAHLRGALMPDLRLSGTGELPELAGRVQLTDAKLRLPGGVLDFERGTIVLAGDQLDQARLNLRGAGRMFDYDVTALVTGTIAAPQVTLTSVPPLAGDTLTMMLLTGTPPPRGNQAQTSGADMRIAVFVGRDVLARLFEDDEEESWEQVLERFELEMGRGITRAGEETINARFRLADNVWREGDTIYITGERDIFDYYNAGLRFVLRFK